MKNYSDVFNGLKGKEIYKEFRVIFQFGSSYNPHCFDLEKETHLKSEIKYFTNACQKRLTEEIIKAEYGYFHVTIYHGRDIILEKSIKIN